MKRLLLLSLSSQYAHLSLAPWCLRAGLLAYGPPAHLTIVEGTVNQSDAQILGLLDGHPCDLLGLSCAIWNKSTLFRLLPALRRRYPRAKIVLGGPEVSFCAADILRQTPQVDGVLRGEGELAFAQLARALESGDFTRVGNLTWRGADGSIRENPTLPLLPAPPSPYCPEYFARLRGRMAYLETSRGCPFSCAFCLSGRDDPPRFFPLEESRRQLIALAQSGARTIKLIDRTFNCNPGRARALIAFILAQPPAVIPPGVCFHLEVAADLFDEETVALLQSAPPGRFQLEIGVQSFHPPTHRAVTRKTDLARVETRVRQLRQNGNLHLHLDLIAGLPREDFRQFARSFDRAFALRPHQLQLGFLKLLPGTRLRREAGAYGYVYDPAPPYEIRSCPWLSAGELTLLHHAEQALNRLYNSGRFARTVRYLLRATGWRPFTLFLRFGQYSAAHGAAGMGLEPYTALVLEWFAGQSGVHRALLRDTLVCDFLSSNRSGHLPACLQVKDDRLRHLRAALSGGRRGCALLYWGRVRGVAADYGRRDPVTGHYPLSFPPAP